MTLLVNPPGLAAPSGPGRVSLDGTARLAGRALRPAAHDDLRHMAAWLDRRGTAGLATLDGNFVLTWTALDGHETVVYRSVLGTTTVYFGESGGRLHWSTDPRRLPCWPRSVGDLDEEVLPALVTAGDFEPGRWWAKGIRRLPAGWALRVGPAGWSVEEIDRLRPESVGVRRLPALATELRARVEAAVERAAAGAERIGIVLSGGLDSSIVASEAARSRAGVGGSRPPVVGLHWGWSSIAALRAEPMVTAEVAARAGIDLEVLDFSGAVGPGGDYLAAAAASPVPFNHSFYRCFDATGAAAARLGCDVLLSGHLADALFQTGPAGPPAAIAPRVAQAAGWLTPTARDRAVRHGMSGWARAGCEGRRAAGLEAVRLGVDAELDTAIVLGTLAPRGISLRHPFADRSLVEFCLGLAERACRARAYGTEVGKVALRAAYLDTLPPAVIRREIRAPYVGVAETFIGHNRGELWRLLGEGSVLAELGVIDATGLRAALAGGTWVASSTALVRAAGVEAWLRRWRADNEGADNEGADNEGGRGAS